MSHADEEDILRRSNRKAKKEDEVFVDVHGNPHVVHLHHIGPHPSDQHPLPVNYITQSDRVNHRFETTNDAAFRHGSPSRGRSNSPSGRRGSPADGKRTDSRGASPSGGRKGSGSPAPGKNQPSIEAELMVAKMLEASMAKAHK